MWAWEWFLSALSYQIKDSLPLSSLLLCLSPWDLAYNKPPRPPAAALQGNYGARAQAESCSDQPTGSVISSILPLMTWLGIPLLYMLLSLFSFYIECLLSKCFLCNHTTVPFLMSSPTYTCWVKRQGKDSPNFNYSFPSPPEHLTQSAWPVPPPRCPSACCTPSSKPPLHHVMPLQHHPNGIYICNYTGNFLL